MLSGASRRTVGPQKFAILDARMNIRSLRAASLLALVLVLTLWLTAGRVDSPDAKHLGRARQTSPAPRPAVVTTPTYERSALTKDGADTYRLKASGRSVTVEAPQSNQSMNTRQLFWRSDAKKSVDQSSCEVWSNQSSWINQPAVALRIARFGKGVRAITVTKNVWGGVTSVFHLLLWDTTISGQVGPVMQLMVSPQRWWLHGLEHDGGKTDGSPGSSAALPWKMCAKVVGDQLTFRIWPLSKPDPGWGDPKFGSTLTLPDSWVYAGSPGSYIGHLVPGGHFTFTDANP